MLQSQRRRVILGGVVLIIIVALAVKYRQAQAELTELRIELRKNQEELAKFRDGSSLGSPESAQLISRVNGLLELPAEERPTMATVTDLSKLENQPFFTEAKVGDRVLIYLEAKKVVLFRPSEDRIVSVAPLTGG